MRTLTSTEEYDLLVLGSGAGGKLVAWTFAQKGQRAVVVERKYVGGACPNIACLPSKNIIHSAKVASFFYRSDEFGISKDNVRIDMAAVREPKRKRVRNLVDLHLDNYRKSSAEQVAIQHGRFVGQLIGRRLWRKSAPRPFRYLDKGNTALVGKGFAVSQSGKIHLSGLRSSLQLRANDPTAAFVTLLVTEWANPERRGVPQFDLCG